MLLSTFSDSGQTPIIIFLLLTALVNTHSHTDAQYKSEGRKCYKDEMDLLNVFNRQVNLFSWKKKKQAFPLFQAQMLKLHRLGRQKIETHNNLETCNPLWTGGQHETIQRALDVLLLRTMCIHILAWSNPLEVSLSLSFFYDCLRNHHPFVSEKKSSKIRK